jgi:hypothetical protein
VRQKQTIVQQAAPRIFAEEHSSCHKHTAVQQTVQRFQVTQEQHLHTTRNLTEKHLHVAPRIEPFEQHTYVRNRTTQVVRQQAPLMPLEQFTYVKKIIQQKVVRPIYIWTEVK